VRGIYSALPATADDELPDFRLTDMRGMFEYAKSFNQPLNNWNVSNDLQISGGMFWFATSFNQPLHAPWYHEQSESE